MVSVSYETRLQQKLRDKTAVIGVVGLGYVGLPLAVAFAEVGFRVVGVDLAPQKVQMLNAQQSYIPDIATAQLAPLVAAGLLRAETDYAALREADVISVCVPTPLRKTKDPDMSYIIQSTEEIAKIVQPGMLIILESTTYPGTTEEILAPSLQTNGLAVGRDLFIAFSPERIDPGNQQFHVRNTPKVVGGMTPACQAVAVAYYQNIVDEVVVVSSPTAAEMVKLLENTFRAVNIGLVNEMALMCDRLQVDVWEVIRAAASKPFGFMPFYPGPGLGGHCIPVDPHYLSWKLKTLNYTARFIELASEINTSMPYYVVDKVTMALNDHSKPVRGSHIAVLGVAYKRDIDDVRESPALDIIQLLEEKGALVGYHDPYVPSVRLEGERIMDNTPLTDAWLHKADCVVIVTDHSSFDYPAILEQSQVVVDTRNALKAFRDDPRVVSI
ncbi:MAG: nucleotide sugar dehydrogenase [Anaerolineae bacterium]|nr:nucleotide sugar dehydrogenase [Anaerolineae bacterium]